MAANTISKTHISDKYSKTGKGTGGNCVSKNQPKESFRPPVPVVSILIQARAVEQRTITVSEFRRFYDRGDLPIKIDHTGIGN